MNASLPVLTQPLSSYTAPRILSGVAFVSRYRLLSLFRRGWTLHGFLQGHRFGRDVHVPLMTCASEI